MWIYVVLCIAALLLLLLVSPIVFTVTCDKDLTVWVRFWFVRIRLMPGKKPKTHKQKEIKVKKQKKVKKETKNIFHNLVEEHGVVGAIQLLIHVAVTLPKIVLRFLKGARVRQCRLTVGVAGDDAAQAALHYGEVCAVLYPFLGLAGEHVKLIQPTLDIYCDYQASQSVLKGQARLYISLFHAVGTALYGLKEIILKNKGG